VPASRLTAFCSTARQAVRSNTTSTQFGWTAGAGIEGALTDNLTARIEYLYVDLGNDTCSVACFPGSTNVSFKTSLVRAGLDFKFGGF
jgi:outer membrane immunogenic protein